MPFVKLDCGILDSTLWFDRPSRDVFLTALLMAEPIEVVEAIPQLAVDGPAETGWLVPPGWYGIVGAAGIGILRRADVDPAAGWVALRTLGEPETTSRTPDFDGRRLVRVAGGYLVLNYDKYRERDYTGAERAKRYRERKHASRRDVTASRRDITQAEVEYRDQSTEAEVRTPLPPVTGGRRGAQAHGAMAGTLPRDHLNHGFCGSRFCVPLSTCAELARRYGEGGDAEVRAWLTALDTRLGPEESPGGPVWVFQQFDAWLMALGRLTPAPRLATKAAPRGGTHAERLAALHRGHGGTS